MDNNSPVLILRQRHAKAVERVGGRRSAIWWGTGQDSACGQSLTEEVGPATPTHSKKCV